MLVGVLSFITATSLTIKFAPLEVAMELTAWYRCVDALDVHQSKLTVCIMYENELSEVLSEVLSETQEFGGFKKDRIAIAEWVASFKPKLVVMESTGIYWKSPYAALEKHGLKIAVVNARHVKQVLGRKTDLADAQGLAVLARNGQFFFVPPSQFRELRLVSRQM